jgi:hypothetical protein
MFYLVYDPTTFKVYGFFHNTELAKNRIKELKKTNPEVSVKLYPYNMNVYIEDSL